MPPDSAVHFTDALRAAHILEPAQVDDLNRNLLARFPDPRALAGELIKRDWVTPFQVNQLMRGRGHELLLGSYVLLERIGEGGMGQVFKARNWKLGRVVALKLIRPERLDKPDAIRRFHREIRAAAQLEHPHIVRAIDADEVGGAHMLVMEYVQGVDLAKLVKQNGPLSAERACDYARQVALGLQHAHERGMVHRDIKPQNLLVTPNGVVKILDMGLARLGQAAELSEGTSTMTQEGAVMGTLDYIAPEQAMDSHTVDIRADLYSLGCTLYFLLTGRPPFPGGTAMEKLFKHQSKEPLPVEQVRSGVPYGVRLVVRKLMAKQPDARYQTPAEAAEALATAPTSELAEPPMAPCAPGEATVAEGMVSPAPDTTPQGIGDLTIDARTVESESPQVEERRRRLAVEQKRRLIYYAGGAILSIALAGLFIALFIRFLAPSSAPKGDPPPVKDGSGPGSSSFEQWLKETQALPAEAQAKAVAEALKVRNPRFSGQATPTIEKGVVVALEFHADEVSDLTPLQALTGLNRLVCPGNGRDVCKLKNLTPLKGLPLTYLDCRQTAVADLRPLSDMQLGTLICAWTFTADLAPLRRMPLTTLDCGGTFVTDLKPLQGLSLTALGCSRTAVADLAPLRDMPLIRIDCKDTSVTDLSPLRKVPLLALSADLNLRRDGDLLRSMPTLTMINDEPAADFWNESKAFGKTLLGAGGETSYVAGVSAGAFQTWAEQIQTNGYRPFFVNAYDAGGFPQFIGLAVPNRGGASWELRHDLTSDEYQSTFEALVAKGLLPVSNCGYLSGKALRFAGIWSANAVMPRWEAHHRMTSKSYQDKTDALSQVGIRPAFVSGCCDAFGTVNFVAQYVDAGAAPWRAFHDRTAAQYQEAIDQWGAKEYRPVHVTVFATPNGPHFGAVFLKDKVEWAAQHGMSAEQFRAELEKQIANGLNPLSVAGYLDGGEVRFAAVWSKKDKP